MKRYFAGLFFYVLICMLSACGGGGGGGDTSRPSTPTSTAPSSTAISSSTAPSSTPVASSSTAAVSSVALSSSATVSSVANSSVVSSVVPSSSSSIMSSSSSSSSLAIVKHKVTIVSLPGVDSFPKGEVEVIAGQTLEIKFWHDKYQEGHSVGSVGWCGHSYSGGDTLQVTPTGGCTITLEAQCRDANQNGTCDTVDPTPILHQLETFPNVVRVENLANTVFHTTAYVTGNFSMLRMWLSTTGFDSEGTIFEKLSYTKHPTEEFRYDIEYTINSNIQRIGFGTSIDIAPSLLVDDKWVHVYGNPRGHINIIGDNVPRATMSDHGNGVYSNDYLVHVTDDHFHDMWSVRDAAKKALVQVDTPDFLVLLPLGKQHNKSWAYYYGASNDKGGTGNPMHDDRAAYDVSDTLRGVITISPDFWHSMSTLNHEIGHSIGCYFFDSQLNLCDSQFHWNFYSQETHLIGAKSQSELLIKQSDGSFKKNQAAEGVVRKYNSLEKYLFGAAPAEAIQDFWISKPGEESDASGVFRADQMMRLNSTLLEPVYGTLTPAYNGTKPHFKVRFVSIGERKPTPEEVDFLTHYAQVAGSEYEGNCLLGRGCTDPVFFAASGGTMSIDTNMVLKSRSVATKSQQKLQQKNSSQQPPVSFTLREPVKCNLHDHEYGHSH